MSHVGDGDIHAYLDGALELLEPAYAAGIRAHLTDCPDCAARLEDERELRSRTEAILAGSGPMTGDVPPFEDIRARASAPEAPRARVRRGVPPALAWAASLILALGTGWAARGVLVPSAAVESEGAVLGRAVVATDADMPESNVEPAVLEVATASPEVRAEEPPRPTERARNEPAVAADRIEPAGQRLAEAEESAAGPPASPAPEEPSREAFADLSGEVLASRRDSAAAAAFRQDRQEADALVLAEAPQAGATEDNRARRADQPLFLPVGGGTIMIPGLEVRSVEFDSSLSAGGVLIVQVVPGGEVVELFYLRLADGSEDEARAEAQDREGLEIGWQDELPSGWSSVVLERDGGWLLARSPIPLEALNALLDALR